MNLPLSILGLILTIIFINGKRYKFLVVLIIMSLVGNLFSINIGGIQMKFISLIALIFGILGLIDKSIFKTFKSINLNFLLKYEILLLIATGVFFTVISPWEDPTSHLKPFSQKLEMKAVIGFIRIISDVLILFCIPFLFLKFRAIKLYLSKIIFTILVIQFFVTIIDYGTNNLIRNIIFDAPNLTQRFLGFNHEPRSLGRNALYAFLILNYLYNSSNKSDVYARWGKILTLSFIVLSFSLSTYISFLFVLILSSIKSFKYLFLNFIGFIFLTFIISQFKFANDFTLNKFQRVLIDGNNGAKVFEGPEIFAHFEAANSAYLYFIWENPRHVFFGTGPNLINIAYQRYASMNYLEEARNNYFVTISPTLSLFRLLARSGIFGVLLLLLFSYKIKKMFMKGNGQNQINRHELRLLHQSTILMLIIYSQWYYFILGFLIYKINRSFKNTQIENL